MARRQIELDTTLRANELVIEACSTAGVKPRFTELDGECKSHTPYVISKNLHRRHLTVIQRSIIGAEMQPNATGGIQKTLNLTSRASCLSGSVLSSAGLATHELTANLHPDDIGIICSRYCLS
jgi:hypothetical protein